MVFSCNCVSPFCIIIIDQTVIKVRRQYIIMLGVNTYHTAVLLSVISYTKIRVD